MAEERILSDRDATIANIITSQPKEFASVDVVEKQQNLFALPKECEEYANKYDFRWVSKDARMLDRALQRGWLICNSIQCSWLPKHVFAVHGGVDKYGHILAFRPKELGAAYRKLYQQRSIDQIKAATKEGEKDRKDSPFYTAKLSPEEEKSEGASGELVQGRDF